jgi:alpha-D-ribose 1-methylphosphonate 5-triphosphate synthase subunit PhnG
MVAMPDASATRRQMPEERRRWMALLARATRAELEEAWSGLSFRPDYVPLRPAESGLVMVRGRAGGTGEKFNLGKMTMTRCAVRLADGGAGLSYIAGHDRRHAELAAVFDALLQQPARWAEIEASVLHPVAARLASQKQARAAEAAATRVDFFTMVREQGEDG